MKQDKVDQLSEQTNFKSKLTTHTEDLNLTQNKLNINLQAMDEQEVELTFQRRPQYRINENSRKRFD